MLVICNLINNQYPNNVIIIEEYFTTGNPDEIISIIDDFIIKYPSGNRLTISTTSGIITKSSSYIQKLGLNIMSFATSATSPSIKNLNNALTYSPFDKYSSMSLFMIYKDYKMDQITILYELGTFNDIYFNTYKNELFIQANYLGININIEYFEKDKINYNIKPNTLQSYLTSFVS